MIVPAATPKRHRLTEQERGDRRLTGGELQRQITDLATILGYDWAHFRALQNRRGMWQVPVEGPLATGWPDLFLASARRQRVMFVEVKRELGDPLTPVQQACHDALRAAGLEVHVWKPSDMSSGLIADVLGRAVIR